MNMSNSFSNDPFSADLDAAFAARLARIPVPLRSTRSRPRTPRAVPVLAAALATSLAVGLVGLAFEVNAVAESQGAGCLDAMAKIHVFVQSIGESVQPQTSEQRRAAEEYVNGLFTPCQGADVRQIKETLFGGKPVASPSASPRSEETYNRPGSLAITVCPAAAEKVMAFARSVQESIQGQSSEELLAAKQKVVDYARGVIAATCPADTSAAPPRAPGAP
jgi:hypothetical protein